MIRAIITPLLLLFNLTLCSGQTKTIYATTKKHNIHYVIMKDDVIIVYRMGYYDGRPWNVSGSHVLKHDTLYKLSENGYKGKHYSLSQADTIFTLHAGNKDLRLKKEDDWKKVNLELNNAYYVERYRNLSDRLNKEFPLNHYSFQNAYFAWEKLTEKNYNHEDFIRFTDNEVGVVYDSISKEQIRLTHTHNFIKENAASAGYSKLSDSLKTLQVEYFGRSVYAISKANPESFYRILQDFPSNKAVIHFAVEEDKELIKQLRAVKGYDALKREFIKDYRFGKTMPYKIIGLYAVLGGLVTWLIVK